MEFGLPADIAALCQAREQVVGILRQHGIPEADVRKIEISVDEACSNVVRHAYVSAAPDDALRERASGPEAIRVVLLIFADRIVIEVIDQGVGGRSGPHRGVSDLVEYIELTSHHGLGLYIIDRCMDACELSYPASAGTHLSMTKYISSA